MADYTSFKESVVAAAEEFKKIENNKNVRIISHLDADGICSASIILRALSRENMNYSISIVQQLDEFVLKELEVEDNEIFLFTDLGAGQISLINKHLINKKVFILDHHEPKETETHAVYVNPHLQGIDGSKEISGSGVVYLFAKALNQKNADMAHVAIIGAIGDVQEDKNGFLKLNEEILNDATENKLLTIKKSFRAFGSQTRPLHKIIEYSTDPKIPGVSGDEAASIQFLTNAGINIRKPTGEWKRLINLTDIEINKLCSAVIMKRNGEDDAEDVYGNLYLLNGEIDESPFREAKEFSTLLNACGRLNKASLGIGACLGNKEIKIKAKQVLKEYKKEIVKAINWFKDNKSNENYIKEGKDYVIINAKDEIKHTIIGTLASIISKSKDLGKDYKYILSLARNEELKKTKVSLRISGSEDEEVDLRNIVNNIIQKLGEGESGGHMRAAGAIIPSDVESKFLELANNELSKEVLQETIC